MRFLILQLLLLPILSFGQSSETPKPNYKVLEKGTEFSFIQVSTWVSGKSKKGKHSLSIVQNFGLDNFTPNFGEELDASFEYGEVDSSEVLTTWKIEWTGNTPTETKNAVVAWLSNHSVWTDKKVRNFRVSDKLIKDLSFKAKIVRVEVLLGLKGRVRLEESET